MTNMSDMHCSPGMSKNFCNAYVSRKISNPAPRCTEHNSFCGSQTRIIMASSVGKVSGVIRSNEPLPLTVDELTKHWFAQILNRPVQNVEVIEAIHGTASKILIKLTFENGTDNTASNNCVTGGFNPDIRESLPFLYAIYRLEAEFYYYLAPRLKIPLPPVLYAGTDTVNMPSVSETVSIRDAIVGLLAPKGGF